MTRQIIALSFALAGLGCGAGATTCPAVSAATLDACEAACDGGDAEVCARIGIAYESGAMRPMTGPDIPAARRYFARACEHAGEERQWLCVLGPSIAEVDDVDSAAAALTRLCETGTVLACHELARSTVVVASIPMELPGTAPEEPAASITIWVLADGSLLLDDVPITLEAIRAMPDRAGARAVIAADASTSHGRVVEVIDALRAAGVTRYAINVAPAE